MSHNAMKYKILNPFFDKKSDKKIDAGEVLELDENRVEELLKAGIGTEPIEDKKSLIDLFKEDRNIVDSLELKELKKLCKLLNVNFTKEDEIREQLKVLEIEG